MGSGRNHSLRYRSPRKIGLHPQDCECLAEGLPGAQPAIERAFQCGIDEQTDAQANHDHADAQGESRLSRHLQIAQELAETGEDEPVREIDAVGGGPNRSDDPICAPARSDPPTLPHDDQAESSTACDPQHLLGVHRIGHPQQQSRADRANRYDLENDAVAELLVAAIQPPQSERDHQDTEQMVVPGPVDRLETQAQTDPAKDDEAEAEPDSFSTGEADAGHHQRREFVEDDFMFERPAHPYDGKPRLREDQERTQ